MSFLKKETTSTTNNLTSSKSKAAALPASYVDSQCQVIIEPVSRPVATDKYVRESHQQQLAVVKKLKEEGADLFKNQQVIMKEENDERMYKQKHQFSSKVSVESLADALASENLCLRCSFKRPGFNSQNSSFMISAEHLREMILSESNEHSLKQRKFHVANDESNAQHAGYVIFSIKSEPQGEHVCYSADYHALSETDDKLFSEH